jgi:hypothetical protein
MLNLRFGKLYSVIQRMTAPLRKSSGLPDVEWGILKVNRGEKPAVLRFRIASDYTAILVGYPELLVVTQFLTQVTYPSGFPTRVYNESIRELDRAMVDLFEVDNKGVSVLVETCGGKRTYYKYIAHGIDVDSAIRSITTKFPSEIFNWEIQDGRGGELIERLSAQYRFNEAVIRGPLKWSVRAAT